PTWARPTPRRRPRPCAPSRTAWACAACGLPRSPVTTSSTWWAAAISSSARRVNRWRRWATGSCRPMRTSGWSQSSKHWPAARAGGREVVITGRAAGPSLFVAPLVHRFGWAADRWDLLGAGTVVGPLLECAGQVTGGYFADPGRKDVDDLARLGFPLAEVGED